MSKISISNFAISNQFSKSNVSRTYAKGRLCHRLWLGPAMGGGEVLRSNPVISGLFLDRHGLCTGLAKTKCVGPTVLKMTKETITYADFDKLDLCVGTITHAETVPDSRKLMRLEVEFGPVATGSEERMTRQILAGIAKAYAPDALVGTQALFLINLEPRTLAGLESQGMLIAAGALDSLPVILCPEKELPPGTEVH